MKRARRLKRLFVRGGEVGCGAVTAAGLKWAHPVENSRPGAVCRADVDGQQEGRGMAGPFSGELDPLLLR